MSQTFISAQQQVGRFFTRRRLVVCAGLLVQIAVIALVCISLGRAGAAAITLAGAASRPGECRVVTVVPFSSAWMAGMQAGEIVRVEGRGTCLDPDLTLQAVDPAKKIVANALSLHVDVLDVALEGVLIIIFSVMGVSIFLRATIRPVAYVTYGLFYCISLMCCLLSAQGGMYLWVNVLLFVLAMIVRGLSATFVSLFPAAAHAESAHSWRRFLPYSPLIVATILVLAGVPLLMLLPRLRFEFLLLTFVYNLACLGVVFWVLFRGLRHVNTREKQLARMVVIGILFLLLPLALSLDIIRSDTLVQPALVRLLPIPLAALPLAFGYALFRHQLVGMTSLVSRQVMRVLLWLLLASLFVFPAIVLLRFINNMLLVSGDTRIYIFAGVLILSLSLFPLAWNKVRDMGDQVFYRDFYQYNHSLRDLSTALTRLQSLDQISAFILPRLAQLLNATDIALLVREPQREATPAQAQGAFAAPWHIYRHDVVATSISAERLIGIAHLATTHRERPLYEPLMLDGVLLLALYDGAWLTGFLCLGPKKNVEPYSKQDTSFLATLAAQLSVLEVNGRYLAQARDDAQKLAALNHRVVSAQEDERRHLALELHDEALQQAMLVVRQLSDAGDMTEVAEVMPLARSVVSSLRRTCLELRPPLLDELGLEEALQWLAQQSEQRDKTSGNDLNVRVVCLGADLTRLPAAVELALYRVTQEALSNALKYAGASKIVVRLRRSSRSGSVSLMIADNGRGFQRSHAVKESLGLAGMHERMLAVGGRLRIRTSPGRGVAVHASYLQSPACIVEQAQQEMLSLTLI